jgi:hypothetical protein
MEKFILLTVLFFSSCAGGGPLTKTNAESLPERVIEQQPKVISNPKLSKMSDGSFLIPNLYWVPPRGVAEQNWEAVFGGTVVEVKKDKAEYSDQRSRKFVKGAIKVERIFLNLPDSVEVTIGSIIRSEDFDYLKKGDKVILFIHDIYESGYVRTEIKGTNSKLGFKVKDWNDPIVAALEKAAPCSKTRILWIEGHPEDFNVKVHDCYRERSAKILDDPQIAPVWSQLDPEGFQSLVEFRRLKQE